MNDWLARQGWGPADLEANRQGHLTQLQGDVLRGGIRRYVRLHLAWSLPWLVLSFVPALWLLATRHDGSLFVLPVMFSFPVAALLAYAVPRGSRALADIDMGRVQEVAGTIDAMVVNGRTGQARVRIGAVAIDFYGAGPVHRWQELRKVFSQARVEHKPVRAYYLPGSRLAVAVEPYP
jgi:hypothetical protein